MSSITENTGAGPVRLIACKRPLSIETDRIDRMVLEGRTVAEHIRSIELDPDPLFARVFVDGQMVPKAEWEWTIPRAGQCVTVRVIPMGGDGGGKMAVRIVAMLAVVVTSFYTAGMAAGPLSSLLGVTSSAGISAVGAGIAASMTMAASLAMNAKIPPPLPRLPQVSQSNPEAL